MELSYNSFVIKIQKKNIFRVLFVILLLQSTISFSQTIRTVGSGGNYSNLRLAFADVNSGAITGNIELQIISSVTDNNTAVLNASGNGSANYTALSIYPTGSGYSLSGLYNGPLIDLNGADKVTIDGRVNRNGSTKSLTISNTSTGTSASTVRFIESAQNNTIQYSTIIGTGTGTNIGVIFFSTASTGTGNSNNTIDNNNITGRSYMSIYSWGTSGRENSNLTISNNNIYDNLLTTVQSSFSLFLDSSTTNCTVTGNSFYDTTGSIVVSSGSSIQYLQFIRIYNEASGSLGNGFTVTNNYMGGTQPNCGGNSINIDATNSTVATGLIAVRLAVGTTSATSVQGNVINKLNFKSKYASPFRGIYLTSGIVDIGSLSGNVIGSTLASDSIASVSTVNANSYGIDVTSSSNVTISNNIIGSIRTNSSGSTTIRNSFYGINKSAVAGNLTVSNNIIGSSTISNSLVARSISTGNDQLVCGIYTRGTGTTVINNNTVANISNYSTRNSATCGTFGINYGGPTLGTNPIYRNYIYKLGFAGSLSSSSIMTGIDINTGITNCYNNVINIGSNVTSPLSIRGISCESTSSTNNIYHNTVYVSGATSGTTANTFGFYKSSSGSMNIRSNIFMNARSGGSGGYHYAIGLANTSGLTINYNNYYTSGATQSMLGLYGANNKSDLATWKSATGQDGNSLNLNPFFLLEGGSSPSNYFPRKTLPGISVSINDDFGNDGIRAGLSNPSMGAWEKKVTYWRGTNSTNWNDASNWTCNRVPYEYEDVEFATVANYTSDAVNDLVLDKDRVIGNLKNYSPKSLIIPSVLDGVGLAVNDTAKVLNANSIQIKSTSTFPNGSLIFNKPTANISVLATVEMYSKANKGSTIIWDDPVSGLSYTISYRWQFFGVPFQTLSALPTYYGSYVREYGETTGGTAYYQKWTQLTNSSELSAFKGYEVTQVSPTTFTAQGNLVVGDKTLNLTYSTGNYAAGYNIFGNSYTSAIDISKIDFPSSGVQKTVYLYNTGSLFDWKDYRDPATSNSSDLTPGRYYAIPQSTSSVTGAEIPSMQGFLLIASAPCSVTIPYNSTKNSMTKNTTLQRINKAANDGADDNAVITDNGLSYLRLDVKSERYFDRTWIFSQTGTSHKYDNGWDGYKLNGTTGMSIYSEEDSIHYQVNTLDEIDSVYLAFQAGDDLIYDLQMVRNKNMSNKYSVLYLTDLLTQNTIELNADTINYSFVASNTISADKRFLITSSKKISDNTTPVEETHHTIKLIVNGNTLKIQNTTDSDGVVNVCDLIGRLVYAGKFSSNINTNICPNLKCGTYLVRVCSSNGKIQTQKIIIN